MRNKYTNRALKQGAKHYSDYRGTTFVAVEKRSLSIVTVFKWLALIALALTIALYIFG